MPKFTFYVDQKQTSWDRMTFIIEADNAEKALIKAKNIYNGESDEEPVDINSVGDIQDINIDENNGYSTRELLDENKNTILENGRPIT